MEYTTEQLNYFRICFIAFNLVPQGLREIFKQEWDFRYKTTALGEWKDTPQNGQDFYNNEAPRSRARNARCLATIQNGNTTEWDCTCLFFAILYSDSIGTTLSPAVENDVDNLRTVRNEIAHIIEAKLTDVEFNKLVGDVLASFNSLKLSVIAAEIDTIKKQTNFPTAEVKNLKIQADNLKAELVQAKADLQTKEDELQTKEKQVVSLTQEINLKVESFCNLTFLPAHEIIRRSNDVTRIMKKMEDLENGSNGAVSTIYLSGSPGCGKSQVARLIGEEIFNKRSQESTGLTFVATLNAETLETLADSYIGLGRKLGITEYTLTSLMTSKVSSPKETIQHVTRLIVQQMKQFSKWVMIADNVVDLSLVRGYLPPTGSREWGHGQVLITTQDANLNFNAPHTYHESLSGGMHPDDAVQLLKQVSQLANQEQAGEVAKELDYQPLALATAAFYAETVVSSGSPGFSWTNYLETLRSGKREATEEGFAKQNLAYSKTMTCAVQMAITRAVESDEVLRQVFCFLSLCAGDSLPTEAAVKFVKSRATSQTDDLIKAKIFKSPLISCLRNEDGELAYLRVHKIVLDVCKTSLLYDLENADSTECLAVAIRTFHSLISAEVKHLLSSEQICIKVRRNTNHCKELHERLTTSFELTDQDAIKFSHFITPEDVVSWLNTIGNICCKLHDVSAADMFSSSALEFAKHMSRTQEGDLLKATALSVCGEALSLQCQYESAKEHYEKALEIRRKVYGEQHGDTATSYNNLGTVYSDLGQHSLAKQQHEKALEIERKVYGEQHGDTATSYYNLGTVYGALNQHAAAKEFFLKALNIYQNIYDEQHAYVQTCYRSLRIAERKLSEHEQSGNCCRII